MQRQHLTSWLFVGALFCLCAVLGILQYRWIGEVAVGFREQLRSTLQANLERLSQDLNADVSTTCRQLIPSGASDPEFAERDIGRRYEQFKSRPQGRQIVGKVALAIPRNGSTTLRVLNWDTGKFEPAEWPAAWGGLRDQFDARVAGGPPDFGKGAQGLLFEMPLFEQQAPGMRPFGRKEAGWVILELNQQQIRSVILPEMVQRHLETAGTLDFEVKVVSRTDPGSVIYVSEPSAVDASKNADASIGILDVRLFGDGGGRGGRGGRGRNAPGGMGDGGRWQMFVRHRSGSLEAVVAQTRWRNLAVTGGVLLLMAMTLGALVRFTRNAQRLAQLQMDFVAGVSHELRTPLTALYTAGHNLRGRVAQQPSQVERYGEMIQQESGRLKDLVEQVLRFASANAGRVIQEPAPLAIGKVIEDGIEASRALLQSAHCTLETHVSPDLPAVVGDPLALKHAIQNLLTNAAKYGAGETHWVGVTAEAASDASRPEVEIRVADRGPGIPEEEQARIFDAFYRGRRASAEQIHGAGLGLNLVKKIVEAHGGTIRVKSTPGAGAEFIVRIPAAPAGAIS
jgi:signal transduction histidine kinase